jgi:hypothetical protein
MSPTASPVCPGRVSSSQARVTRQMLHERTCAIARRAGRLPPYVTQSDYEQAKRELTGSPDTVVLDENEDNSPGAETTGQSPRAAPRSAETARRTDIPGYMPAPQIC